MAVKKKKRQKSGLLIVNDANILVFKKIGVKKRYVLAGGFLKNKETPENALIREVEEETGIVLNPQEFHYIASHTSFKDKEILTKHYFVLPSLIHKFENKETHKFQALEWVNWKQAIPYMNYSDKMLIERFYTNLNLKEKWITQIKN